MRRPATGGVLSGAVVVGYDGSEAGEAALARAIEEASTAGSQLVVVTVAEMPLDPEGPMSFGTYADRPAASLPLVEPPDTERVQAAARRRVGAAGIAADYVWEAGDVPGALVREARNREAAAIVVGKGHHGRLARWLGTDVAAEVERTAGCRVIVVDG